MGLLGGGQFGSASQISFQDCDLMCCSSRSTPLLMERSSIEGYGIWDIGQA